MKENLYNSNDEENHHVIKLLKELPKEKAPDNFEYNLSVKIKNKNFGLNTKDEKYLFPWKVLTPAAGFVTAAMLLFFTFFNESDTFENPFQFQPKLRTELGGNLQKTTSSELQSKSGISENDVIINNVKSDNITSQNSPTKDNLNIAEAENKKPAFPFNNSTNLDEAISDYNSENINKKASLAGRTNLQSPFNGFYIRNEVDKAYVEALKARLDSLKKEYRNNLRKGNNSE